MLGSLRHKALLVGFAAVGLATAAPAAATQGVAIDVGQIAVSEDLKAGGEYRLPAFGVRNPGTESTSYRMAVSYIDDQAALQPPEAWFVFSPSQLTLGSEESKPVQTRLVIPPDAEPGTYAALIGPQIASNNEGAQVGAAAAARLSFTVVPSSAFEAWMRWLGRFIGENPWVLLIPIGILAFVAWWFLHRRVAISIARRT
jgi:hypothetical protein